MNRNCFRNPEKEETVAVEKEVAAMEPSASEKERWYRELTSQLSQLRNHERVAQKTVS